MTDEQIKVLEAMRLDRIMRVQDKDRSQRIKEEGDALTAALDFIRDMREIEAEPFRLEKAALEFTMRRMAQRHQTLATKDQVMQMLVDFYREAVKVVKGGKE